MGLKRRGTEEEAFMNANGARDASGRGRRGVKMKRQKRSHFPGAWRGDCVKRSHFVGGMEGAR